MTDARVEEEKPGMFKRMKNRIFQKASSTDTMKKFKESEEYKKIEEARKEMQEFKHNLKEEIDST